LKFVSRRAAQAALTCLLLVGMLFGVSGNAMAQTATASVYGDVTDPQGASVVGAKVSLTNVGTQAVRSATTDDTGRYQFVGLQPGRYNLRVELAGFRTAVRDGLDLLVSTVSRLNLALELGAITETVVVTSEAAPLNTTDASLGNVITPQQVMSLPLEARNPVALLTLQAGVSFSGDPSDARSGAVQGGRSDQANVTLDGIDVNDQQTQNALTTALPIPLESIQEFRFTTSNAGADQGRSSGGQVGFVTRGGSNDFHGSLFWTHRNTVTTANDFFNNAAGIEVPKLLRNQYGGSLGGRLIRDRLFFFGVYEGNKRREEQNVTRIVPSDTLRNGMLLYNSAGGLVTLNPADIMAVDPAGLGVNPAMLTWFQQYPSCNDFNLGLDTGLNFCGFRFNSPVALNSNVWVTRWDFNITRDARHMVSFRGTLNDLSQDLTPQNFPGQPVQQQLLDNSKGYAITYTSQWTPTLTNIFRYGLTRLGRETTGQTGDVFNIRDFGNLFSAARATIRKLPTHHLQNDASWIRGNHNLQGGFSYRWISNDRGSFANSFPTFSVNDGFCLGLCNSLVTALTDAGYPAIDGSVNPYKRAIMGLFGMITTISSAAFFDGSNNVLAAGQGSDRLYKVREWEMYFQDTWRMHRDLTVTLGLRYGYYGVPWEANGLQTQPNVNVGDWLFERARAMEAGIPSNTIDLLSWDLAGPANGGPGYYAPDRNNFAPNVSFAYTLPFGDDSLMGKVFGSNGKSVLRGGVRVVFDRVGGSFVVSQDLSGSVGLVSPLINAAGLLNHSGPACTSPPTASCMAPRFSGIGSLPSVSDFVSVPAPGFPATPAGNFGNTGFLIDNDLRTPYSYAINLAYGRELPSNMAFEMAYVGRFGHKLLAKADYASPLVHFVDPASGQTLAEAMSALFLQSDPTVDGFATAPPSAISNQPFFENLFSAQAGTCPFSGGACTATQSVYDVASVFFPSFADSVWLLDVLGFAPANTGEFTFFQQQFQSLPTWTNMANSNYHGMTMTVRKRYSHGLLFDFNYTWSKSMDNASTVENVGRVTGQIADIFRPKNNYSVSTHDLRHNITFNWVYDLPFGRGKWLGSNANAVVNQIIGGWQTSGIYRWRTAFPISFENGFNFPTNYFLTGPGTQTCAAPTNVTRNGDQGAPNLFGNTAQVDAAVACLARTLIGASGSRNTLRGPGFYNIDFGLRKTFTMPFEGHKFVFDWQVFNLFNNPNFDDRTMRLNPESIGPNGNFGRFTNTIGQDERNNNGRVMQFALRYEF